MERDGRTAKATGHPGATLKEYLAAHGLTVQGSAELLGVARPTLSRILNGWASISPDMAVRLEEIGWADAESWLDLQAAHDLACTRGITDPQGKLDAPQLEYLMAWRKDGEAAGPSRRYLRQLAPDFGRLTPKKRGAALVGLGMSLVCQDQPVDAVLKGLTEHPTWRRLELPFRPSDHFSRPHGLERPEGATRVVHRPYPQGRYLVAWNRSDSEHHRLAVGSWPDYDGWSAGFASGVVGGTILSHAIWSDSRETALLMLAFGLIAEDHYFREVLEEFAAIREWRDMGVLLPDGYYERALRDNAPEHWAPHNRRSVESPDFDDGGDSAKTGEGPGAERRAKSVVRNAPEWELLFLLPNLKVEPDDLATWGFPPQAGLTLGLEGVALTSAKDERVVETLEWSAAAAAWVNSFHNGHWNPVVPAALIAKKSWGALMGKDAEPTMSFLNAVAVAALLRTRARWPRESVRGPSWSDSFDYHPIELRPDGSALDISTPALDSFHVPWTELSLTCNIGLGQRELDSTDERLALRLGAAWKLRYQERLTNRATTRLFRSIEVANEALRMTSQGYRTTREAASASVRWATSVEMLAAPGEGYVSKDDCFALIKENSCSDGEEEIAADVFRLLYQLRNDSVHGREIDLDQLCPFGQQAPPLLSLASSVYRLALVAYLNRHWPTAAWAEDAPEDPNTEMSLGLLDLTCADYETHLRHARPADDRHRTGGKSVS
ncbi:HigA family addiction module antitoxin [Candidatus Palauibacter sp.]|uniref:HigA family addiction module antitoxin n=1 Tax=Candidatus Palauibacter sp. TaxID=3101350 RepID=UPI003B5B90DF